MSEIKSDRIVQLGERIGRLQPSPQATRRALDRVLMALRDERAVRPHWKRSILVRIGIPSAAAAVVAGVIAFLALHGPTQPMASAADQLNEVAKAK